MTVRQLIEMLQTIQNKDLFVYYYDEGTDVSGLITGIEHGMTTLFLTTRPKED